MASLPYTDPDDFQRRPTLLSARHEHNSFLEQSDHGGASTAVWNLDPIAQPRIVCMMIKIADKTSNLRSIIESPPTDWSPERRREYFDWAGKVVAGCRGVNARLEERFDEAQAAVNADDG